MKFIGLTHKGLEDVAVKEVEELGGKKASSFVGGVVFEMNASAVVPFIHKTQSLSRVLLYGGACKVSSPAEIAKIKFDTKITSFLEEASTFKVECERLGEQSYCSAEVNQELGAAIVKQYGKKVDMSNPDVVVFVQAVDDTVAIGIDLCGYDLSKRMYKLFQSKVSLKGTLAYGVLRLCGFTGKESLLDPFCGDGMIEIEAALHATGLSPRFYEKRKYAFSLLKGFDDKVPDKPKKSSTTIIGYDPLLHNVSCAKKNAKIAGVNKQVSISKADIDWLDTKVDEKSMDLLVTQLPLASKHINEKVTRKLYKEFFYQAEFVLKKTGRMVVLTNAPSIASEYANEYKFNVDEERSVWQGLRKISVLICSK